VDEKLFLLRHKDITCAVLTISGQNVITDATLVTPEHLPFLGHATLKDLNVWLGHRAIPGTRRQIEQILQKAHCETPVEYLIKNLGLSLTDAYWLCPFEAQDLTWEGVNLYQKHEGLKLPMHNGISYDPSASLNGAMTKYIEFREDGAHLIKTSTQYAGLQCLNEAVATEAHRLQGHKGHAAYRAWFDDSSKTAFCSCRLFTNEHLEFVPAHEVIGSAKKPNHLSAYDFYVLQCEKRGLADARPVMDYQTLMDFALTNVDRHTSNFGILRDPDTLKFKAMAPIFDNGNSMFFDHCLTSLDAAAILNLDTSGFHRHEEDMLPHVQNASLVNASQLPAEEWVASVYAENGVPEMMIRNILAAYRLKLGMLHSFQNGEKVTRHACAKKATAASGATAPCAAGD